MEITKKDVKVLGRVAAITVDGIVASAEQVYDETYKEGMFQDAINRENNDDITAIYNKIDVIDNYTINGYKISESPKLTKADVGLSNVTNDAQVKRSEMGVANGVATLNSSGQIPSSQLPSYVDDVLEFDTLSSFPNPGEDGKIYVTKDTDLTYRWTGSQYVEISKSLALGETSSTAYAGDKGKANRDALNSLPTNLISSVSLGSVSSTQVGINVQKITKSGLNYGSPVSANFNIPAATTSAAGVMTAQDKKDIDTIQGDISTIKSNISSIESNIDTIENNIDTIENNISSIEGDISSIENNVSSIKNDITRIDQNIDQVEQNVTNIQNKVNHIEINEDGDGIKVDWDDIDGKPSSLITSVNITGSGNVITNISFSNGTLTITKGSIDSLSQTTADGRYVKKSGDTMTGTLTAPAFYES